MGFFTPSWKIEAQNLVCKRNNQRLVMSDNQLQSAINMFVSERMRIIHDSQKLVNETKRPAIFFDRLDTLLERAEELCQLDAIKPGLLKPSPAPQLRTAREKLPEAIDDMIDRCWKEAMLAATSVKTEKSKQNKFEVLFGELRTFDNRMYPQNRAHIERLQAEFENMRGSSMVALSSPAKESAKKVEDPVIDIKPDIDLARALFASIQLGSEAPKQYRKKIEEITSTYQTQQKICRVVVALCGEPDDVEGLNLLSTACSWAGAAYRPNTIKWTKRLIEAAGDFSSIESSKRRYYCSDVWTRLGAALEGEYLFEDAYEAYTKADEFLDSALPSWNIIDLLVKMNRLDEAIGIMKALRKTVKESAAAEYEALYPRMLNTDWYIRDYEKGKREFVASEVTRFDAKLNDLLNKKEHGYVYKPRKKITAE